MLKNSEPVDSYSIHWSTIDDQIGLSVKLIKTLLESLKIRIKFRDLAAVFVLIVVFVRIKIMGFS